MAGVDSFTYIPVQGAYGLKDPTRAVIRLGKYLLIMDNMLDPNATHYKPVLCENV